MRRRLRRSRSASASSSAPSSAAGGMSIVAVLVLRALGEWREIQDRRAGVTRHWSTSCSRWPADSLSMPATPRWPAAGATAVTSTTKSSLTDLVTVHDQAAEATIVAGLERRPSRRRHRRRGGHRTGRARRGVDVARRPDRRHHELRLRPAPVVDVGRRRRRRRHARRGRVRPGPR